MKLTLCKIEGTTPARVNRVTGEIFADPAKLKDMSPDQIRFILAHEMGHFLLQTTDEFLADAFAFEYLVSTGGSLTQGVRALTDNLKNSPSHIQRSLEIYKNALLYDYLENGNQDALVELETITEEEKQRKGPFAKKKIYEKGILVFEPTVGDYFHSVPIQEPEISKEREEPYAQERAKLKTNKDLFSRLLNQYNIEINLIMLQTKEKKPRYETGTVQLDEPLIPVKKRRSPWFYVGITLGVVLFCLWLFKKEAQ